MNCRHQLFLMLALTFASRLSQAAPVTPEPRVVCSALTGIGVASGAWRRSSSTPGGWVCSNMGSAVQFGPAGTIGLPSNVSYFVVGSGPKKIDHVQIKLNVNNVSTFQEGKTKLVQAATSVMSSFGETLPPGAVEQLTRIKPRIDTGFKGKAKFTEYFESSFPGYSFKLSTTQSRLMSISMTVRNDASSGLWD